MTNQDFFKEHIFNNMQLLQLFVRCSLRYMDGIQEDGTSSELPKMIKELGIEDIKWFMMGIQGCMEFFYENGKNFNIGLEKLLNDK